MKNKICITIAGKSNVGKSSLINFLCKSYITSESNKLQTTRINTFHDIRHNNSEMLFIDTPGVSVLKKDLLSDFMKKSYIKSLEVADTVIILFDILSKDFNYELAIMKICDKNNIPTFLSVNKVDLMKDDVELKEKINGFYDLLKKRIYPISVHSQIGINNLIEDLSLVRPISKNHFFDDFDKDHHKKIIIQELIRGVINNNAYGEVPYECAVFLENIEVGKKLIRINSTIIVNNLNQKKIIIGRSGENIKKIGMESRKLIEKIYLRKVYIELFVDVTENWKNNINILKKIGFGA